jgi:hypothetical protein
MSCLVHACMRLLKACVCSRVSFGIFLVLHGRVRTRVGGYKINASM